MYGKLSRTSQNVSLNKSGRISEHKLKLYINFFLIYQMPQKFIELTHNKKYGHYYHRALDYQIKLIQIAETSKTTSLS